MHCTWLTYTLKYLHLECVLSFYKTFNNNILSSYRLWLNISVHSTVAQTYYICTRHNNNIFSSYRLWLVSSYFELIVMGATWGARNALYKTFNNNIFSSYRLWLVSSYFDLIVMGATWGARNAHSFRNTWFHSLWGVYEYTHSVYIHYIICQSKDYVYRLKTGLFASLRTMFTDWRRVCLPV